MMSVISGDIDFIFTKAAWLIPAFNGSLSALSSIMIMSIILRSSPESRTSGYHIIMFFMSFWDTIASVAMALGTLPMPSDVHEVYPFAGKALGTIGTCEAQGFLIWMGTLFVLSSNSALNIYYVCTLRYRMTEDKFKRRILPVLFVLAVAASISIPSIGLKLDTINPQPISNFCSIVSYPLGCDHDHNDESLIEESNNVFECIRGEMFEKSHGDIFPIFGVTILGITFSILIISLVLVVATVFDAEMSIRRSRRAQRIENGDGGIASSLEIEFKRTRVILFQALLYIGAFLLTWVWLIILATKTRKVDLFELPLGKNLIILVVFFPPLQGFFNAIIFTYQKAHTLCQVNSQLHLLGAFKHAILHPSTVPEALISRIEIVQEDPFRSTPQESHIYDGDLSYVQRRQQVTNNSRMRRLGSSLPLELNNNDASPNASINAELDSVSLGFSGQRSSLGDVDQNAVISSVTSLMHEDLSSSCLSIVHMNDTLISTPSNKRRGSRSLPPEDDKGGDENVETSP